MKDGFLSDSTIKNGLLSDKTIKIISHNKLWIQIRLNKKTIQICLNRR